uniref:Odorant receptor n=1 Tax=Anopheles coluzzii TaxID=1518534 RepID=A0A8W7PJP9_ANOCL
MIDLVTLIRRKLLALERKLANDPDQFVLLHHLTFLFAIRNDAPRGVGQFLRWCCHLMVPVFVLSSYCYKAYWYMTHSEYNSALFNVVGTIWIMAGAFVRRLVFDRGVLVRLEQFLNDRSFREDEPLVRAARQHVRVQNNRYLFAVCLTLVLEASIFSGTNLMLQPEFMLLYQGHAVGGFFTQLLYGWATCLWGSLYVLIFAFIYVLLNVFRGEMSLLVESFERIDECFHKYRPELNTASAGKREEEFWRELQALIKLNVQRHVELLENLGDFGSILKPFSFIQYYGSFTLIGYYCFILMYKGVTPLTVVYIAFIVFLVAESFLFCRILSQINDLHARIGTVMCELEWYDKLRFSPRFASAYRQMRASFLIIIIRSQKPLSFSISAAGTISMARFAELLNSSYSLMTIMFQLKERIIAKLTSDGNN